MVKLRMEVDYALWPQGTGKGEMVLNRSKGNLGLKLRGTFSL